MADASAVIDEIISGLDRLADEPIRLVGEDRSFMEIWGWNMPAMNRHEFAAFIRAPIEKLGKLKTISVRDGDLAELTRMPAQIKYIQDQVIVNLPGGNAFHVYIVMRSLLDTIEIIIRRYISETITLEEIEGDNLIPKVMMNEIRAVRGQLDNAKKAVPKIEQQLEAIREGAKEVRSLPSQLQSLQAARDTFNATQSILSENISATESARAAAESIIQRMNQLEKDSNEVLASAQAAFSATTSVGLGKEFSDRGKKLSETVLYLSFGLVLILSIGGYITFRRIGAIHDVMAIKPLNMDLVWANVVAMFASLTAPVWLAWLLTRQIGQRFRLAEDYNFKASVARAYAGYREEAARLKDVEFEKQLFASTLRRIDEEPLRHVDRENESTPAQAVFGRLLRFRGKDSAALVSALVAGLVSQENKKEK